MEGGSSGPPFFMESAMRMLPIQVEGVRELDAGLASLGTELATIWGHKAFRASAEQVRDAWIAGAPYDPTVRKKYWTLKSGETRTAYYGHLRDNIKVRKVKPQKETAIVYGVTTGDAFWAYFLEFGTAQMIARPWARPIVERMRNDLIQTQVDILKQGVESAARKSRGGKSRVMANGRNG
jgi:HK97 gp10 family phage protein